MTSIPCPACGVELPPLPQHCPACGVRLTGPDALQLWEIDVTINRLQRERTRLLAALAAPAPAALAVPGAAGPPTGPLAAPPGVVAASTTGPPPAAAAPRRTWTTQQTLLAVGVVLVLAAASIALAVAWFLIGRWGQVLVMGGLTALACWASLTASRRRLPSTAEALAIASGGLMLLDASAARRFGLAGLDAVDARAYTVASGLLLAVLLAALHRRDGRVAAFAVLALAAASTSWAGVVAFASTATGTAALSLLGAVVFAGLHLGLPADTGFVRRAATGPAAGWTLLALVTATVSATDTVVGRPDGQALASAALLLVLGAGGALVVRQVVAVRAVRAGSRSAVRRDWQARWFAGDWRAVGVVALAATAAVPIAVLAVTVQVAPLWAAVGAVLLAAGAATVVAARPLGGSVGQLWLEAQCAGALLAALASTVVHQSQPAQVCALAGIAAVATATAALRPHHRSTATAVAAVAAVLSVGWGADLVSDSATALAVAAAGTALVAFALARPGRDEEAPSGAVGVLALGVALALTVGAGLDRLVLVAVLAASTAAGVATARLRSSLRPGATGATALAGTWLVRELGLLASPRLEWVGLALAGVALAALAAWRLRRPEEAVLGAAGVLAAVTGTGMALDRGWVHAAAGACAAYALTAVGYAALPRRRAVVTLGVAAATAGTWLELDRAGVGTLEAYTLSLAALLLAAGLWSRDLLGRGSWPVGGPALMVALVPSALLSAGDDGVVRPLVTVTVAVVVLVAGAWRRWQALVVVGAGAAVVVAVTQLGPYAAQLPRYLTLGSLGVALLAVGARYEQRRADARQAVSWLASMS